MTRAPQSFARSPHFLSRRFAWLTFYVVLGLAAVWLVWHQSSSVMSALRQMRSADDIPLIIAAMVFATSIFWASGVYHALLPRRLRYARTCLVQAAGLGANKLLPAGSGAIGLSYVYLRRSGQPAGESAAAVTVNNTLGFVGNSLLLAVLLVVQPNSRTFAEWPRALHPNPVLLALAAGIVILLLVVLWRVSSLRSIVRSYLAAVGSLLRARRLVPALLCSVGITLTYCTALWLVGQAAGVNLGFGQAAVALTAGVAATSLIPTPGGIGAAEAGIYGALSLYGVPSQPALAVAVLYRLVTFWLPLIYGLLALIVVRHKRYI